MGNLCPREESPATPPDVLPGDHNTRPGRPGTGTNSGGGGGSGSGSGGSGSGGGGGTAVPGVPPFPVPPFVLPEEDVSGEHTYVGRREQLYCRHGVNMAVLPGGKVVATDEPFNKYAVLEVTSVDLQEVRMRAVETGLYIAMDGKGKLYGERDADEMGCIFIEQRDGGYLAFLSKKNAHLGWYLGFKRNGQPKLGAHTRWGQKAVQFLRRAPRPP